MAVEKPSVITAASQMTKLARGIGGFQATANRPVLCAQIQVMGLNDL